MLAGLHALEQVLGHPLCGHSWEGYCIEQILAILPKNCSAMHYRTHAGAELDLVLEYPSGETTAIEVKRTLSPRLGPAFVESMRTINAACGDYVLPAGEGFPLSDSVEAIGLESFLKQIAQTS